MLNLRLASGFALPRPAICPPDFGRGDGHLSRWLQASERLPSGNPRLGSTIVYKEDRTMTLLVDQPVFAGQYFQSLSKLTSRAHLILLADDCKVP